MAMRRKKQDKSNHSGANLGFEQKLWPTADKMRDHALGLIFLKHISDSFEWYHEWLLRAAANPKSSLYVKEEKTRYQVAENRDETHGRERLPAAEAGEMRMNFAQAKKILDLFKKLSVGRSLANDRTLAQFNATTRYGADMSKYQALLAKALAAITGKTEEQGVESLFQRGGTVLSKDSFKGIDDFEVIAYLVILGEDTL